MECFAYVNDKLDDCLSYFLSRLRMVETSILHESNNSLLVKRAAYLAKHVAKVIYNLIRYDVLMLLHRHGVRAMLQKQSVDNFL